MKDQTNLVRRGAVYQFRTSIPLDLREHYKRAEIRVSLHTKDKPEAMRLAAVERVRLLDEWQRKRRTLNPQHRTGLTAEEIQRLVGAWSASVLSDDERRRALGVVDLDDAHERLSEGEDTLRASLPTGNVESSGLAPEVARLLREHGIALSVGSNSWRLLVFEMMKAAGKINTTIRSRSSGNWIDTPAPPVPMARGPTLNDLFTYWRDQLPRRPRTVSAFTDAVKKFSALHPGITDARRIERRHIVEFRDHLLGRGLSPKTVWKNTTMLGTIFAAAVDGERLEKNPAARIKIPRDRSAPRPRVAFDAADMERIAAALVTLEKSDTALYWLITLSLATGCRLAEIMSLRRVDVRTENSIAYIEISVAAGPVKSTAANRRVPIHPAIKEQFITYVNGVSGDRLFPGATAPALGKRAGRWLRHIGITDPRKVLHSARHWFRDALRAAAVGEEVADALLGHSRGSTGRAYGGDSYPLAPLAEAVGKIKLPAV